MVHFVLLTLNTYRNAKAYIKLKCCRSKLSCDECRILGLLPDVDAEKFESNHSEKSDRKGKVKGDKESEWEVSVLGNSDKVDGYKMHNIRWSDLGRKFMFKRPGNNSYRANVNDESLAS